jgi:serpin B
VSHVSVRLGVLVVSALCGFALAASCGQRTGHFDTVMSSVPRNLAPDATPAELAEVVTGNGAFGLELAARLRAGRDANLMVAPTNVATALAMTWAGACGSTAEEMAATLHFPLPQERLHTAFDALDLALASRNTDQLTLKAANALWAQRDYDILPAFLDTLAVNYGAPVRLLDFMGNAEGSRNTINDWVSVQTATKIPELLPTGSLTNLTRFVLTSAIYFKASWELPFNPEKTEPGLFHRADGTDVTVDKMNLAESFDYASGDGWQAVDLQYVGGQTSMVVVVPDAGQFATFEAAYTGEQVQTLFAGLASGKVQLSLPKFSFKNTLELKAPLISLGMVQAFGAEADFSGMIEPTVKDKLLIDEVYHDTFITIDEKGTEAGAATGVVGSLQSDSGMPGYVDLDVDRPFLFFIRDVPTGAVLFAGRVVDPKAE